MVIAKSKITAQGQISVPAEIRRRLGAEPGAVLEWNDEPGGIVVRRAGRYTLDDVHKRLFPNGPPEPRSLAELRQGIVDSIRERHGRR